MTQRLYCNFKFKTARDWRWFFYLKKLQRSGGRCKRQSISRQAYEAQAPVDIRIDVPLLRTVLIKEGYELEKSRDPTHSFNDVIRAELQGTDDECIVV